MHHQERIHERVVNRPLQTVALAKCAVLALLPHAGSFLEPNLIAAARIEILPVDGDFFLAAMLYGDRASKSIDE